MAPHGYDADMEELTSDLAALEGELLRLIPKALRGLVRSGKLTDSDPADAVAIHYATVGNGSIFHWLSVRTSSCRLILEEEERGPDPVPILWNPAEFDFSGDLSEFVELPASYTDLCDRLTGQVVDVIDSRPDGNDDYREFDELARTVRRVALTLTRTWADKEVPAVEPLIFYAINWYQDSQLDSVARSVDPSTLERAGFQVPPRECYHCSHQFTVGDADPLAVLPCPSCGQEA